jgi:Tfp pilus assembly protein PilP
MPSASTLKRQAELLLALALKACADGNTEYAEQLIAWAVQALDQASAAAEPIEVPTTPTAPALEQPQQQQQQQPQSPLDDKG